ncbi:hypothetical protein C2G38_2032915 [Gigaspora rosea]|uniref:HMG box domain-containing protein n=1 Tax=Gigaspora rosea TaxID=44941 RepID=A0A397VQI0_9GLOM|nr:hypothetical protein C2G38_2032915 [Gigaspora rosea]CAG8488103.1 18035_t:CDS:2 [Gigaspora rosea]
MNSSNSSELLLDVSILELVYNPPYSLGQLISTRTGSARRNAGNPPRPPNCFFLLKNAIMLALRSGGRRFTMPFICKMASQVWESAPIHVKSRYEELAKEATQEHLKQWPDYRFRPKKRQIFKAYRPRQSGNHHNPKREEGKILDLPQKVPQPPPSPITPPSLSPPILSPPFSACPPDYFYIQVPIGPIGQQYYTPYPVGHGFQELYLHIEEGSQMINGLNAWGLHHAS